MSGWSYIDKSIRKQIQFTECVDHKQWPTHFLNMCNLCRYAWFSQVQSHLLLNIKPKLLHYPETPNTSAKSAFIDSPFVISVKPPRCTTGCFGPVNGINIRIWVVPDCCQCLYWIILWIESVSVPYYIKTKHCCLYPNRRYNPPLATHLAPPQHYNTHL